MEYTCPYCNQYNDAELRANHFLVCPICKKVAICKNGEITAQAPVKTNPKIIIGILVTAVIVLLAFIILSSGDKSTPNTLQSNNTPAPATATPAQMLAAIDAGSASQVSLSDEHVIEIQTHLSNLASAFSIPETRIADITYNGSQQLTQKGLSYSNLHLLRIADKDLDVYRKSGVKYEEFISLLVLMTTRNE